MIFMNHICVNCTGVTVISTFCLHSLCLYRQTVYIAEWRLPILSQLLYQVFFVICLIIV